MDLPIHHKPHDADLPLRERKKIRTMRRIRAMASELLEQTPYEDLTVERIAEAAEVSPSTVYRYFRTKDRVFLWDEYDDAILERFHRYLADRSPIDAMADAISDVFVAEATEADEELDTAFDRFLTVRHIPQLADALRLELDEMRVQLTDDIVKAGWPRLESALFAGAVVTSMVAVLELYDTADDDFDPASMILKATNILRSGFDTAFDPNDRQPHRNQPNRPQGTSNSRTQGS